MDWQEYGSYNRSTQQPGGFVLASMICGIVSVTLCCLGPLTVPVGALGILFFILSRRQGRPTHPMARAGLILSGLGIAIGVLMTVYSVYTVYTDPEMRQQYEQLIEYYYGTDFGGAETLPETETGLPSNIL